MGIGSRAEALGVPISFEQLSVTTALGCTIPAGTVAAIVSVDGADARFRSDGTAPTSTVGHKIADGQWIELPVADLVDGEWVAVSGTALVNITYYKN